MKILAHRVNAVSRKVLPLLEKILNFCVKCKNAFILETVIDGVIWNNTLAHTVSAESSVFPKKSFSAITRGYLEFLHKMPQKRHYVHPLGGEHIIFAFSAVRRHTCFQTF